MSGFQSFLAAIVCFTRIPIPWTLPDAAFARASLQLPLLGLMIGGLQWALYACVSPWLPHELALFWALVFPCLLSGGMHEDGLADFADGMLGGQTISRRLEIMKDPRVGSYGLLSLIIILGGGFLALKNLAPQQLGPALVLTAVVSRSICIPLLATLPYVNHAGSRSHGYIPDALKGWGFILPLWPLIVTVFLVPKPEVLWFFGLLIFAFVWLRRYLLQKLGGLTGDCLGAAIKLTEFGGFMLSSLLWSHGSSAP